MGGIPRVTAYASYGTEPATGPLIEQLRADGFEVLLPRVEGDRMDWGLAGQASTLSRMGIAEPTGSTALLPLRAMLIPALAVTTHGDRLGKGGGYYDRVLAQLPSEVPVAALVRDEDVLGSIPTEAHDRRVDVVITPSRIIECRGLAD